MQRSELAQHPLWQQADLMRELLGKLADGPLGKDHESARQLRFIVDELKVHQNRQLKTYYGASTLNTLQQSLAQVQSYLEAAASQPQSGHTYLASAQAYIDSALNTLPLLPSPRGIGAATEAIQQKQEVYIDTTEKLLSKMTNRLAELEGTIATQDAKIQQLNREAETASSGLDAIDARITEDEDRLNKSIATNSERVRQLIADTQAAVQTALDKQQDQFTEAQVSRIEANQRWLNDTSEEFTSAIAELRETTEVQARQVGDDLQQYLDDVAAVAGQAADDQLARHYKENVDRQRSVALWAFIIGGIFVIATIVILTLFLFQRGQLDWPHVVLKSALSLSLASAAGIAIRFGTTTWRAAEDQKEVELELRSIRPFLHNVEGADQARIDFIDRRFRRYDNSAEAQGEKGGDVVSIDKLGELILKLTSRG